MGQSVEAKLIARFGKIFSLIQKRLGDQVLLVIVVVVIPIRVLQGRRL